MVSSPARATAFGQIIDKSRHFVDYLGLLSRNLLLPKGSLFGTDGIRGVVGEFLSEALAVQVGFAAGQVWQSGVVLLGMDSRNSSETLARAVAAGLTHAGLSVWHLGLCPTPCVASLITLTGAIGGVMISASHNPPQDNGIKFFGGDGLKLSKSHQAEIEQRLKDRSIVAADSPGEYSDRPELRQIYLDHLASSLAGLDLAGLRIVLDMAWGAAVDLAPVIFSRLGAEVVCLHDRADGDRINVNCGSTHLGLLQKAVLEQGADLGLAFDGDADRLMAIDNQGQVIDGDYILYLWGGALLAGGKLPGNLLVTTVMANLGFERAWRALGGELIRTPVGDQYVQAEMQRTGAKLGGEQSGHILCPHYSLTGDGLLTGLHLAALTKSSGVTLAQLRQQSFQTYPQTLCNVRVEDRTARLNWQECSPLVRAIAQAETAMAGQGRVLVRASGTEPVIRVMVEAADQGMVTEWSSYLVAVVKQHLA